MLDGKYDVPFTKIRDELNAECVLGVVLSLEHGHGCTLTTSNPAVLALLPDLLDKLSAKIRKDFGHLSPLT